MQLWKKRVLVLALVVQSRDAEASLVPKGAVPVGGMCEDKGAEQRWWSELSRCYLC